MPWYFTVTSDEFGAEDFGPYETKEEAAAGIERVSQQAFAMNDGIERDYTMPWEADYCMDCGRAVPSLIICPDGAEICQPCFDEGKH